MNTEANVSRSALEGLSSGLLRFRDRFSFVHDNVNTIIAKYFMHFEEQQRRLQKLFDDSVNRLASAENELKEAWFKRELIRKSDGETELVPVDLTPYYNKVRMYRETKENYEQKLETCKSIIDRCMYQQNMHKGQYKTIVMGVESSVRKLDEYINDVNDYNGLGRGYATSLQSSAPSNDNLKCNPSLPRKETKLIIYDDDGNPMVNADITIVDNTLFGFGTLRLQTNENGEITTDYITSNDCSIYLDGNEIYSGNLFQEMEYNRYGDSKFISGISDNNSFESEQIVFSELDDKEITVTHKIELEENGNEVRREETFKRDEDDNLREIEIAAKSDELKSRSKDGWIKIIKDDEDDRL